MTESQIVPGVVAFMRSTTEPVFVLDVIEQEADSYPHIDPTKVIVRRGLQTRDGMQYETETFFLCELTTQSDMNRAIAKDYHEKEEIVREFQERSSMPAKAQPVN